MWVINKMFVFATSLGENLNFNVDFNKKWVEIQVQSVFSLSCPKRIPFITKTCGTTTTFRTLTTQPYAIHALGSLEPKHSSCILSRSKTRRWKNPKSLTTIGEGAGEEAGFRVPMPTASGVPRSISEEEEQPEDMITESGVVASSS